MEWVTLVIGVLDLANKLMDRARQSGELTVEQDQALTALAASIFAKYSVPPPPPSSPTPSGGA